MRRTLLIFACTLAAISPFMAAQPSEPEEKEVSEKIVVYGSKSDREQEAMGTRTIVITAEEIQTYQWQTVAEVLTSLPGLNVVAQGGEGSLTRVFARGASSENTLVLLDGVRLNDPSGVGRGYDFGHLNTAGIARIEIILGPQTTLYGTDASSGVINIVSNNQLETLINAEAATEDIIRFSAETRIMLGDWKLGASASRVDTDDLSARQTTRFETLETDRYTNTTIRTQLSRNWSKDAQLSFNVAFIEGDGNIDSFDGDDPNHTSDYNQDVFGAAYTHNLFDGNWRTSFHANYQQIDRQIRDGVDPDTPEGSPSSNDFASDYTAFEWRNNISLAKHVHLLAGAAYEREQAEGLYILGTPDAPIFTDPFQKSDASTSSLFSQLELRDYQGFDAAIGGRWDDHDQFGSEGTYRVSLSYAIPVTDLRLRASFGTGFKAPSLYQLYSVYGNLDLEEEKSEAFEAGLEGAFANGFVTWGLTYFDNSYENQIDFFFDPETFASFYDNLDYVETDGWEAYTSLNGKAWQLYLGYDKLDAEDRSTPGVAVPLLRRYEDKASLRLSLKPMRKLQVFGEAVYHGESLDSSFSTGQQTLDDYTLVDLGLRYDLTEAWQLTARGENIFDEDYVRVIDYQTPGDRFFLGVSYRHQAR